MSDEGLEGLSELGRFEIASRHAVAKQGSGRYDGGQRGERRQGCTQHGVHAAEAYIVRGQALVGDSALLEEQHPGRYRRTDIRKQDEDGFLRKSSRKWLPGEQRAADRSPVRMAEQGHWDDDKVEHRREQG